MAIAKINGNKNKSNLNKQNESKQNMQFFFFIEQQKLTLNPTHKRKN